VAAGGVTPGVAVTTASGDLYISSPAHRGRPSPSKSSWILSLPEEVRCFEQASTNGWASGRHRWGNWLTAGKLTPLGMNHWSEELHIARFVDGGPNTPWHGFPADYRRNKQDRPPVHVLAAWRDAGIIEKHVIAKIRMGKRCSL
jgi:hypothetical protein